MLTLRRAFFDGIVSPILVTRWKHDNHGTVLDYDSLVREQRGSRWIVIAIAILSIMAVWSNWFFEHTGQIGLTATIIIGADVSLVFGLVTGFFWGPMSLLLRDCKQLSTLIVTAGLYDHSALKETADRRLIELASEMVFYEDYTRIKTPSYSGETCRNNFKVAFDCMSKFGLTEKKWDPYFDMARTQFDEYCKARFARK